MDIRRILPAAVFSLLVVLGLAFSVQAFAHGDSHDEEHTQSMRGQMEDDHVNKAKEHGARVAPEGVKRAATRIIDVRIAALNRLKGRIDALKRIDAEDKTELKEAVEAEIKTLQDLRAEVEASSDPAVARKNANTVLKDHRVFAVFMPRIRGQAAAARMQTSVERLEGLADKIDTRIADAKGKGEDVTSLEALASDFDSKIAAAKEQIANGEGLFEQMKPGDDLKASRDLRKQGRDALKAAHNDLRGAAKDLRQIAKGLRELSRAD